MCMGLRKGGIVLLILFSGCTTVEEEQGECLKWRTTVIEKKERLPFPMRGEVVRKEVVTYCAAREETTNA